jgi:hypothetical protein
MSGMHHPKRFDAIEMIEADHQYLRRLFRIHEAAKYDAKPALAESIFQELEIHTMLEEKVFYPTLESRSRVEGRELVEEARLELAEVKQLITELRRLDPTSPAYEAKLRSLRQDVEHHISGVAGEMLPLAERILDETSQSVGEAMHELKQTLRI